MPKKVFEIEANKSILKNIDSRLVFNAIEAHLKEVFPTNRNDISYIKLSKVTEKEAGCLK